MKVGSKLSVRMYRLVIAHYLVSACCFLLLSVAMLGSGTDFLGHYFSPKLLALTHLAALGWGSLVIFGAAYQLIPVVFETRLHNEWMPVLSFVLFMVGLAWLVYGFWVFDPGLPMQLGAVFLLLGILFFAVIIILTSVNKVKKVSIQQDYIVSSSIWLVVTAILGVLLVFNFQYPFLPKDHLTFLRLHSHVGLGGWFVLLICGVSSKLIPMFVVSRTLKENWLNYAFYLINAALILFVISTYLYDFSILTYIIAGIFALGLIFFIGYIVMCMRSRIKKKVELPVTNALISFVLLVLGLIITPLIVHFHLQGNVFVLRLSVLYGSLLFLGWISAIILGLAFKTFPFIIWSAKYEDLAGKFKTPLPADLFSGRLFSVQTLAFVLFALSFYPALCFSDLRLITVGTLFLILCALCYVANLLIILFHKVKITANG